MGILITIFSSFSGAALSIIGILKLSPSLLTNAFSEVHEQKNRIFLEGIKAEFQANNMKELESYKVNLLNVARYSEYQFKLYNELWKSLYDMKIAAENLWREANLKNLREFSKQFSETEQMVGQSILLLNDNHYQQLSRILDTFGNFEIGKEKLIDYRNKKIDAISNTSISRIIESNGAIKSEYIELLDLIVVELREYIKQVDGQD